MTAHNEALKLVASALRILKYIFEQRHDSHFDSVMHDINKSVVMLEEAVDKLTEEK